MRVIAGMARGIALTAPGGLSTRPTADRLKENLFNILSSYIANARFLDLYSGSGAIGIEALSRGAAEAVLVENAAGAVKAIKKNLQKTHFTGRAEIINQKAEQAIIFLNESDLKFDIIFLDPPYEGHYIPEILNKLASLSLLAENGIIIAEMPSKLTALAQNGLTIQKEKAYGNKKFVIYSEDKNDGRIRGQF